jgi:hypothetical protein
LFREDTVSKASKERKKSKEMKREQESEMMNEKEERVEEEEEKKKGTKKGSRREGLDCSGETRLLRLERTGIGFQMRLGLLLVCVGW